MELTAGMRGDAKLTVGDDDTSVALEIGVIPVLASSKLIALFEEATVNAVANELDAGTTTVVMRVQFDHLQPTPVGAEVTTEAVLKKIDGRRLKFEVSAFDSGGLIAAGKIIRVLVAIDDFMGKCCTTPDSQDDAVAVSAVHRSVG